MNLADLPDLVFTQFLVYTYFQNQAGQGLSVALSAVNSYNLLQPMGMVYNLLFLVRRSNLIFCLSYPMQSIMEVVYNILLPMRRSNLILSLSYFIQSLLGMVFNLLLLVIIMTRQWGLIQFLLLSQVTPSI